MDTNAMDLDPMDSQPQPSSQLPALPVANSDQSSASALPRLPSAAPLQQIMFDSATLPTQSSIQTASVQPTESKKISTKVDISSLMSPPDPVIDSFPQTNALNASVNPNGQPKSMQQSLLISPPISPHTKPASNNDNNDNAPDTLPNQLIKDPVLYPAEESLPSNLEDRPLFAPADRADHKQSIDRHVRNRSSSLFKSVSPPRVEDYELALTFKSQVVHLFLKDRKGWLRRERAYLEADRAQARARQFQSIAPAKPVAAKSARVPRLEKSGVSKPQGSASRPIRVPPAVGVASGLSKTTRPAARRPSASPEPTRRGTSSREDKDFNALRDYCPPISSLPNKPNSLKVDWRGQPIDLSNDPHRHLLHPDEVILAGSLRLDCATYLTNKRRMFERRLECLRTGKEFRKTDAQQACKIDVNKASKLWTAFDKVGWLNAHWVRRFL